MPGRYYHLRGAVVPGAGSDSWSARCRGGGPRRRSDIVCCENESAAVWVCVLFTRSRYIRSGDPGVNLLGICVGKKKNRTMRRHLHLHPWVRGLATWNK